MPVVDGPTSSSTSTRTSRDSTSLADDNEISTTCSSAKKLRLSIETEEQDADNYYILMSFSILRSVLAKCKCEICHESIELVDYESLRAGLSHKLSLQCKNCGVIETFHSSSTGKKVDPGSGARRTMFDVNLRSVLAFREIGKGHNAMNTFTGLMNLAKPISKTQYDKVNDKLFQVYQDTALYSCEEAATETIQKIDEKDPYGITDCQVSVDGSWQKRGHTSLNGVVTVISKENGKCLDHIVLSKKCKGCQTWSNKTSHPGYNSWKANHDCQINHKGSSGSMESR